MGTHCINSSITMMKLGVFVLACCLGTITPALSADNPDNIEILEELVRELEEEKRELGPDETVEEGNLSMLGRGEETEIEEKNLHAFVRGATLVKKQRGGWPKPGTG